MQNYFYAFYMMYAVLTVGLIAFLVYILPSTILSLLEQIPAGWIDTIENYGYSLIAELNDHLHFIAAEQARHNKNFGGDMKFFAELVMERREVNAGRRMPVSIRA